MDEQTLFNKVYLGLKSQGFVRSENKIDEEDSECMYRSTDGLKCAAGHLIPDHLYDETMEQTAFANSCTFKEVHKFLGIKDNSDLVGFVCQMQFVHDNADDIQAGLIDLAEECNLTIPTE